MTNLAYLLRPIDGDRENIAGMYAEPNNSLDMIYIGASSIYRGWSPLQAYNDYGIASYTLSAQGMPAAFIENMIVEANKTQKPKLYMLEISPFMQLSTNKKYTYNHATRVTNALKYSANRSNAISNFSKYTIKDLSLKEKIKLRFDIIPNRKNITKITNSSFKYMWNNVKIKDKGFRLINTPAMNLDQNESIKSVTGTTEINPDTYTILDQLFETIERENVKVLFTYAPRLIDEDKMMIYNTIEEYINKHGYKFYETIKHFDDMDINFNTDFYNQSHMNYSGASKYTDYMAAYLTKKYKLPDRRRDDNYEEWDKDFENYSKEVMNIIYSKGLAKGDQLYMLRPMKIVRRDMIGLYAEKKNSLDMIYIGASGSYRGWSPLQAWNERGFTSYTYAIPGLTAPAIKHLLIEAQKTQNPQVYVIDISPLMQMSNIKKYGRDHLYRLTNSLNYSPNRTKLINSVHKYSIPELTETDLNELEYDILVNKENKITKDMERYADNIVRSPNKGFKLVTVPPKTVGWQDSVMGITDTIDINEDTYKVMDDLFKYIEDENLKVLFTYLPRLITSDTKPIYNTIEEYIRQNGYEYYDVMDDLDKLNLDFTADFYNNMHTNYNGGKKYTKYFAQYIQKKYKLPDRRNDSDYEDWQKSGENYKIRAKKIESQS
jgi:hypothetical protein